MTGNPGEGPLIFRSGECVVDTLESRSKVHVLLCYSIRDVMREDKKHFSLLGLQWRWSQLWLVGELSSSSERLWKQAEKA
jgi:hypothetical protein